jgi:hypothetical protein
VETYSSGDKKMFIKRDMGDFERLDFLIKFYAALGQHPRNGLIADTEYRVRKEIEKYLSVEPKEKD